MQNEVAFTLDLAIGDCNLEESVKKLWISLVLLLWAFKVPLAAAGTA